MSGDRELSASDRIVPASTDAGGGETLLCRGGDGCVLTLGERLDAESVARIWPQAMREAARPGRSFRVDAGRVQYCDGSRHRPSVRAQAAVFAGRRRDPDRGAETGIRPVPGTIRIRRL